MGFIRTCFGRVINTSFIKELMIECISYEGEEFGNFECIIEDTISRVYFIDQDTREEIDILYGFHKNIGIELIQRISSCSFLDFDWDTLDNCLDELATVISKIIYKDMRIDDRISKGEEICQLLEQGLKHEDTHWS